MILAYSGQEKKTWNRFGSDRNQENRIEYGGHLPQGFLRSTAGNVRNRHELIRFTPEPEKYCIHDGFPCQASPRHSGTGGSFSNFLVTDPPRGRPIGDGGSHQSGWSREE